MWIDPPLNHTRQLFVALKIAEVCNIRCHYCYFFEKNDQSFLDDPAHIAPSVVEDAAKFLAQGAKEMGIPRIVIALHGGEPLMLGKRRVADICDTLHREIAPHATLALGVQTNGLLLDREWIELLASRGCSIGLSLDGPQSIHDSARLDKKGHGTFDRAIAAVHLLKECCDAGIIRGFQTISVINPNFSADDAYHFFVDELGLKSIYLRAPTVNWDDADHATLNTHVRDFQLRIFELWANADRPDLRIRTNIEALHPFLADEGVAQRIGHIVDIAQSISIRSNGDVCPDDSFPPLSPRYRNTGYRVGVHTLSQFYQAPLWNEILGPIVAPTKECTRCQWLGVCGGGFLATKYREGSAFAEKSVYCEAHKAIFGAGLDYASRYLGTEAVARRLAFAYENFLRLRADESSLERDVYGRPGEWHNLPLDTECQLEDSRI